MILPALNPDVRKTFLVQASLIALLSLASAPLAGVQFAFAALFGGLIALISSWLAYRSVLRVSAARPAAPALFGGLALRLAAVIALFVIAFGVLHLPPLPVIAAFVAAQFAPAIAHFTH
jgi:F0F1-type ATP synthase assembly protein I